MQNYSILISILAKSMLVSIPHYNDIVAERAQVYDQPNCSKPILTAHTPFPYLCNSYSKDFTMLMTSESHFQENPQKNKRPK